MHFDDKIIRQNAFFIVQGKLRLPSSNVPVDKVCKTFSDY